MIECSYCERLVEKIIKLDIGDVCSSCEKEMREELLIDLGEPSIYSNKYFDIFLNKNYISFALDFNFTFTYFRIGLGPITILSR